METHTSYNYTRQEWYVLSAIYKKEMAVRDELSARGYETYLPMHYELTHGRRPKRVLRPAIHTLLFVKASRNQLREYRESTHYAPYVYMRCMRRGRQWTPIVVSEKDMQNFMRLTSLEDIGLEYFRPEELRVEKGEPVKIMDGIFAGTVGNVVKLPRRRGEYLVVEIPGVTVAAVKLKPEFVQPMSHKVPRSTDVERDVARLDQLARQLLYGTDEGEAEGAARSIIVHEVNVLRQALTGCKTVMPLDKASCTLAHFLAALALEENGDQLAATLTQQVPRLRSVSLLRLRASIYLWLCCGQEAAGQFVRETMSQWDDTNYSDAQRHIISERRKAERLFATTDTAWDEVCSDTLKDAPVPGEYGLTPADACGQGVESGCDEAADGTVKDMPL